MALNVQLITFGGSRLGAPRLELVMASGQLDGATPSQLDVLTGLKTIIDGGVHLVNTTAARGLFVNSVAGGTVNVRGVATNADRFNIWVLGYR
jgi:hypothetical protein